MRGNDPQARGCDVDSDNRPSSAFAAESVPTPTSGCLSAVRTSSSLMMAVMTELSPRSAITRSITASRGSFPIALPICVRVIPSYLRRSSFSTDDSMTPSPPLAPYHWFSHVTALASSMSFLIRSRVAGSFKRPSVFSRPPSRAHNGKHESRPFAAGASRLDPFQHVRHLAEVGFVRGLQVPDLGRNRGAFRNREHFVERLEDARALRPLMREVHAAVTRGDFGQLDDLVGRRKPIGNVLQRRAQAECSLLHRFGDQLLHALQFRRCRGTIVLSDDVVANAAGAHERADVDRGTRPHVEPPEIVAEGPPIDDDTEVRRARGRLANHPVVHGRDRRALAGDLGGHALEQLARRAAVDEDVELGLAEEIDESGRDDEAGCIDGRAGRRVLERANRRNPIADDADVAAKPRRTGAVDNAAVDEQDVETPRLLRSG